MEGSSKPVHYRADIDGLRGVAITAVVLFHAGVPSVRGGFIGVDVFFVISGFLIGSLVYREMREGRFTLRRFYERRAKRILPALFAVLGVCLLPACLLLSGVELAEFAREMTTTLLSVSNVFFALHSDYFASAAELHPLLMTWSLGVEEQFYIFFPLLMFLVIRYAPRHVLRVLALMSAVSLLIAVFALPRYPTQTFYLLPSRAWELGLGTMLGIWEHLQEGRKGIERSMLFRNVMATGGAVLLLVGVFGFSQDTLFPGWSALVPTVGAVMLIAARGSWLNRRILSARPLVGVGLVSYSWYLWHWPMMSFARIVMAGVLPLRVGVAIAVVSLGVAVASWAWVEQPFRRSSNGATPILVRYGLGTAIVCLPALTLIAVHGWAGRYPAAQRVDEANDRSVEDPCLVRYRDTSLRAVWPCQTASSVPAVALMGDSHAAALAEWLRSSGRRGGWDVEDYTKASCPQLGPVTTYLPRRPDHAAECAEFNRKALARVAADPRTGTVVLAAYWSALFPEKDNGVRFVRTDDRPGAVSVKGSWNNAESGLRSTVEILRGAHKEVYLVLDAPRFRADALVAARTNAIPTRAALNRMLGGPDFSDGMQAEDAHEKAIDEPMNRLIRRVSEETGARVVDLPQNLCRQGLCRFERDHVPFYIDSQHLSVDGAKYALGGVQLLADGRLSLRKEQSDPSSGETAQRMPQ